MPGSRIAPVVLGLAASVYGTASLTGGWLGTPPWVERSEPVVLVNYADLSEAEQFAAKCTCVATV